MDTPKCSKCQGDQAMTPICLSCGCIPIADLDFQSLRDEVAKLKGEVAHWKAVARYNQATSLPAHLSVANGPSEPRGK